MMGAEREKRDQKEQKKEKNANINVANIANTGHANTVHNYDKIIREYLKQGREKLFKELNGTREAIRLIAKEKTKDFMLVTDRGLDKDERNYLAELIVSSMYQTFCYGYSIGKIEGSTNEKIYL